MYTDLEKFNGEMSDVVNALELSVVSAIRNVIAGIGNRNLKKTPFFVTLQSKGKREAYAWVSSDMVWHKSINGENMALAHELNICAETLNRPLEDTFITIVHELVHLWNIQNGIKDTSRNGQFHNQNFAQACEDFCLKCDVAQNKKKYGYTTHFPMSEQHPDLQQAFEQWKEDIQEYIPMLTIGRDEEQKAEKKPSKKKSNTIKYTCPNCGNSVRGTKKLSLICGDCHKATKEIFEMVLSGGDVEPVEEEQQQQETVSPVVESVPAKEEEKPVETVVPVVAKEEEKPVAKKSRKSPAKKSPAKEEKPVAEKPVAKKTRSKKTTKAKELPVSVAADHITNKPVIAKIDDLACDGVEIL